MSYLEEILFKTCGLADEFGRDIDGPDIYWSPIMITVSEGEPTGMVPLDSFSQEDLDIVCGEMIPEAIREDKPDALAFVFPYQDEKNGRKLPAIMVVAVTREDTVAVSAPVKWWPDIHLGEWTAVGVESDQVDAALAVFR